MSHIFFNKNNFPFYFMYIVFLNSNPFNIKKKIYIKIDKLWHSLLYYYDLFEGELWKRIRRTMQWEKVLYFI